MTQRTRADAIDAIDIMRADGLTLPEIAALTGVSEATLKRLPLGGKRSYPVTIGRIIDGLQKHYGASHRMVPVAPTVRRLRALACKGWSVDKIAAECGESRHVLMRIRNGSRKARVSWGIAENVAAVYERLWSIDGGCGASRATAFERGWFPPMAWDEEMLDDPEATPAEVVTDQRYFTREGRLELARELRAEGWGPEFIADDLGIQRESLENNARLAGDDELLRWLQRGN